MKLTQNDFGLKLLCCSKTRLVGKCKRCWNLGMNRHLYLTLLAWRGKPWKEYCNWAYFPLDMRHEFTHQVSTFVHCSKHEIRLFAESNILYNYSKTEMNSITANTGNKTKPCRQQIAINLRTQHPVNAKAVSLAKNWSCFVFFFFPIKFWPPFFLIRMELSWSSGSKAQGWDILLIYVWRAGMEWRRSLVFLPSIPMTRNPLKRVIKAQRNWASARHFSPCPHALRKCLEWRREKKKKKNPKEADSRLRPAKLVRLTSGQAPRPQYGGPFISQEIFDSGIMGCIEPSHFTQRRCNSWERARRSSQSHLADTQQRVWCIDTMPGK